VSTRLQRRSDLQGDGREWHDQRSAPIVRRRLR
jgi:hypothetical protein